MNRGKRLVELALQTKAQSVTVNNNLGKQIGLNFEINQVEGNIFEVDNAPGMQVQDEEISLPGESAGNINIDDSSDRDKLPDDDQITQPDREVTLSGETTVRPSTSTQSPPRRRQKSGPMGWKRTIERVKRLKGESYKTKNKVVQSRETKTPRCVLKPNHDCSKTFPENLRHTIYKEFRSLLTLRDQREFIIRHVTKESKKRQTTDGPSRRESTKKYYFTKNGGKEKVCREFFLDTLNISEGLVRGAIKKVSNEGILLPEMRGKHEPKNKLKIEEEDFIRQHILSFPSVESHYCRKKSEYRYLESCLNITKMHAMYEAKCWEAGKKAVGLEKYRRVFREYKLTFHVPIKDHCKTCGKFEQKKKLAALTEEENELFLRHIERKNAARNLKNFWKEKAKADKSILAFEFDLQAVLSTPKGAQGPFFYVRKLAVYNLTVYNLGDASVECFVWDETQGKRGSTEISTCINSYIAKFPTAERVVMLSDSCGGQQKNSNFVCMCLNAVKTIPKLKQIDHIYFEPGHSLMECDSIHQKIFKSSKQLPVYTPEEWVQQIRNARKNPSPYNVTFLEYADFFNFNPDNNCFTSLVGEKKTLPFRQAVCFQFKKDSLGTVDVKTEYESGHCISYAPKKRRGRPSTAEPIRPYDSRLPISEAKWKDLMKLCDDLQIPTVYHQFYKSLPRAANVRDRLAEPNIDESDDD